MWKIQKGYSTVTRTFRLPEELTEKLEVLASKNKISLNQLVIQCLRYATEQLDDKADTN
ncbi:toxin-antitoxin system HicB family antitoxin [Synergistaceae bacterium OttesenSCG-928-D05]|nr:toxin-antitoxin system HicB family antitoxin [Synergistaceae bacterium OttesenSCG-928-D05]